MTEVETTVKEARLVGISIERHERGWLYLSGAVEYGGTGQGFGGMCLDTYDEATGKRVVDDACALAIGKLMGFCNLDLPGCANRTIKVHADVPGFEGKVVGLEWPAYNEFNPGVRLMFRDLFPEIGRRPDVIPCVKCGDRKWMQIDCPDKKPGCLVAHFRSCDLCNAKAEGTPFKSLFAPVASRD